MTESLIEGSNPSGRAYISPSHIFNDPKIREILGLEEKVEEQKIFYFIDTIICDEDDDGNKLFFIKVSSEYGPRFPIPLFSLSGLSENNIEEIIFKKNVPRSAFRTVHLSEIKIRDYEDAENSHEEYVISEVVVSSNSKRRLSKNLISVRPKFSPVED